LIHDLAYDQPPLSGPGGAWPAEPVGVAQPATPPLDVSGLGTGNRDLFLHRLGDELRSVVGPDVSGNGPQDEQVGQNVDHIDRLATRSRRRSDGAVQLHGRGQVIVVMQLGGKGCPAPNRREMS
jgi:hypothetical protein